MLPRLNRRRAQFVLTKIDEILAWEQRKEAEKDTRFVELGKYLCEVRAGQYWRLENLKSFDEFLERRFPESRRKAYYLMSIHEHLPPVAGANLDNGNPEILLNSISQFFKFLPGEQKYAFLQRVNEKIAS